MQPSTSRLYQRTRYRSVSNCLKKRNFKKSKRTGDLICNKTAGRIRKVSKTSPQNSSETVKNEHNKKIPKEKYVYPEKWRKMIDDLGLM